ncbi:MAG: 16S rRNA (cytidine(1402)-2'-O)-methyltransferase [Bacteroidetes bacterium]|nr:16S rRNA (cytidine(1402)-2'-O)-methyltransferase [Bacteroidota bacterium]MCL4817293.1 16S rRNA (cytidine(1402)-2'-O)-methyltransferase [Flavobacteriales bacterium]NOG96267.1 16S rRNA (cytidine(1402)-2'-O)-methyltransferase [Bacteroidota bacterium]WKZ75769.1 MAG: 16S rRNA (cytidine(1402)-2'-O)-methyltransferase [Vicingaceae bacterium]CAG0994416.1 Ribosomal RNA small subunit methyltransferase I [Flavobacteriales bacterium]
MPKLYIVPTPIGNLQDITLRALDVLKMADVILAEDTRQSSKLLQHYTIQKPLISFHQHNEHKNLNHIIQKLKAGETLALISDAGTPGISDPAFLLVRECIKENIEVECLPGATAFVPALINSGLPCERFCFEGFLPHKKGRSSRLLALKEETRTILFYESPYRILKTLEQLIEVFGEDRQASISRELTKLHEETVRGTLRELLDYFKSKEIKGEFVIVVQGKS